MRLKKIKGFGGRSYGPRGESKDLSLASIQKMQEEMAKKVQELEASFSQMEVTGTAGGGAVRVTATCDYRILSIEYDDELLQDKDMFNDLIIAAVNEALREIQKRRDEEMAKLVQGGPSL
jgi:DNA-binding YbaB/EbfC family protein